MTEWVPILADAKGPRYLAIVEALEADITAGRVNAGVRLLPQRELAIALGVSVGTVSKAYAEAEQRGLVSGEIGRGTFVLSSPGRERKPTTTQAYNLALNVPPETGEAADIAAVLANLGTSGVEPLIGYLPHQGTTEHRDILGGWLRASGLGLDPQRLMITQGLQHAASLVLTLLAPAGTTVLCEELTYSGQHALAAHQQVRLHGIAMDEEGLIPDELNRAISDTGAPLLYAMPTLQTPTAATMSAARRSEIAEILRRRHVYLFEDDAYVFLPDRPRQPISELIPELGFYATSFSKCLAPALRVGALYAPEAFRDRLINGLRATGWMAAPAMVEAVARLALSGRINHHVEAKRRIAEQRRLLAYEHLGPWLADRDGGGYHVWLPLPTGRTISSLVADAASAGVMLSPSEPLATRGSLRGIRLCLGGPKTSADLSMALKRLRGVLTSPEAMSVI